jgi:surfactin synthase thioesterase subunit
VFSSNQVKGPFILSLGRRKKPIYRIFCFPHAGGSPHFFSNWSRFFPDSIEVCAICLPGRSIRFSEPFYESIDQLASDFCSDFLNWTDSPYLFFGHSFGALLSYCITGKLKAQNYAMPKRLLVSGRKPPHLPHGLPLLNNLSDSNLIEELIKLNGLSIELARNIDFMDAFLPIIRADLALNEGFAIQKPTDLEIPISAFGGIDDPGLPYVELLEWSRFTSSNFDSHMLPGDHFFVHTQSEVLTRIILEKMNFDMRIQ